MPIFFHNRAGGFNAYDPKKLQAQSLFHLLSNWESFVKQIPVKDRWDMYFCTSETHEPRKADDKGAEIGSWAKEHWGRCEALFFDIDGIAKDDFARIDDYTDTLCGVLGVSSEECTVVYSGGGFHFYFWLKQAITEWDYYKRNRDLYKAVCKLWLDKLKEKKLSGKPDTSVFDHVRIMRMPGTENRKREPVVTCMVKQFSPVRHDLRIETVAGVPVVEASDAVPQGGESFNVRTLDVDSILADCNFLKWVKANPADVKEPHGYAALSILGRMDLDRKLARDAYKTWTSSNSLGLTDPDAKIDHALSASGPRTCKSIEKLAWIPDGCKTCPHFNKVKTPLQIQGPNFIRTKGQGYWNIDLKGRRTKPNYDDLMKGYKQEAHYFVQPETERIFVYTGTHYTFRQPLEVKAWCEVVMLPKPESKQRSEFMHKVMVNNLMPASDFLPFFKKTLGKVNLTNGILDVKTRTLSPHTPDIGFKYVLPYDYDPNADCPMFKEFLHTVMMGRPELMATIVDFLGYCLWPGYEGVEAAFWWLAGTGSNGKSRFLDIVNALLGGRDNIAYFKSKNFRDTDRFALSQLDGKLLCITEEVNEKFLGDDMLGIVKDLSSGGTISVEGKGIDHWAMTNTAKFIFTSNKEPVLEDTTVGIRRRFIAVPFDMNFEEGAGAAKKDTEIAIKIIKAELPGILNLALKGLDAMVARGKKPLISDISKKALDELVLASDSVERWSRESLVVTNNETDFLTSKELYAHYCTYMADPRACVSNTNFSKRVRAKVSPVLRDRKEKKIGGKSPKGVFGVRLLESEDSLM